MGTSLKGRTLFVTGASRGIGRAIAVRAARDGANIVVAAKTTVPHPRLPGTIFDAADAVEKAGGQALAVCVDVRDEAAIQRAIDAAVERFGGLDIVVNNASAIALTGTLATETKRYDLMHAVNVRATFLVSRSAIPHLRRSAHAHILNIAPPPSLEPRWFAPHLAYTMTKMGMSFCVLGMAEELRAQGIAVNALWPRTVIATAAVRNLLGGEDFIRRSRKPEIVADAAHAILTRAPGDSTGCFFIDEDVLRAEGIVDFSHYAVDPDAELLPDLFL